MIKEPLRCGHISKSAGYSIQGEKFGFNIIKIKVCYCSIFDDCWLSGRGIETVKVKSFQATLPDRFMVYSVNCILGCGVFTEGGARGRTRTVTVFPPGDFKSPASTNFATRALLMSLTS